MILPEKVINKVKTYIRDTEDCIEYPITNKDGYPEYQPKIEGKKYHFYLHRVSYQMYYNEDLSTEDIICHKCDNPSCINPKHLFKGTHNDNVQDKVLKGRQAKGKGNGRYVHGQYTKEAIAFRKEQSQLNPTPRTWSRGLSEEKVIEIKLLLQIGTKVKDIVLKTNVSASQIKDIKRGKTYKDINV